MLIIFTTGLQDRLDLGNRNNRHVLREKEEAGEKQSERTKVKPYFPDRRTVIGTPGRREVIPVRRSYDDHKTLVPHPDVNDDTHKESKRDVSS